MEEMTLDQQKALALAGARLRLQEQEKQSGVTQAVGSVSVSGAPDEFKDAPTISPEFGLAETSMRQEPKASVIPSAVKPEAAFKYQEDPEIQRIAGTPEERKAVGTVGTLEQKEIPFKDLYTKPENLKIIKDYAEARFGTAGKQRKDESDEDFTKRWMTAMRQVEWNTTLNTVPELNWLSNAKQEDVVKAARAHNLFNSVPSFYSKEGQPGIRPLAEGVFAAATDPLNLVGFGAGAATRYAMSRGAIQNVLSNKLKAMGGIGALEAGISVGQSAVDQQVARETGTQRDQWDKLQFGISAAIGALGGAAEGFSTVGKKIEMSKDRFEAKLAGKKVPYKEDEQLTKLKELFDKNQSELEDQFDIFEGRKTLDALSPPTELTEAAVRKSVHDKALEVAMYVMYLAPEYQRKEGQKISQAVNNIIANLDTLDENVFESALSRANITAVDFADAIKTTTSDSAKVLNSYSQLSKIMNKLGAIDPEAQKRLDEILQANDGVVSPFAMLLNGFRRVEREGKALVVSGLGTTARNVLGTSVGLTFDAGAKLVENSLYAAGRGMKALKEGDASFAAAGKGLVDVFKDSFSTIGYLVDAGLTAETADALLKRNPKLQSQIFSALQDSNTQELTRLSKFVNTLNVAQDAFFRRAIFSASVERQLKRIGLDMDELLANDRVIPSDILKQATDETLKATFSYVPKQAKQGVDTLESKAENFASLFVKTFEGTGGSLLVTFPRFMTNAMAFQYRYSPLGGASGISEITQGLAKGGDAGQALVEQGTTKMARGVVGTAAMYAAYKYRMENQDSEWFNYKNEDGSTVDLRGVFPIGPYLAAGDFAAKLKLGNASEAKLTELMGAISGMKMPAGTQLALIDELPEVFAGATGKDAEKVGKAFGRVIGDFFGRFTTPGKSVVEYLDLFDKEGQIARDPNVIEGGQGFLGTLGQTAVQRVIAKLPELKEDLPEFQPYFSEKAPVRAGEFFNSLSGVRQVPEKGAVEQEFIKLKIDPYAVFGSTGDKIYDRAFIKTAVPIMESRISNLLKSDRYQTYTPTQKKLAFIETLTGEEGALSVARQTTQAQMMAKDRDRVNRMKFNKLPAVARKGINELYAKEHDGKTMDENKDYGQVYKYEYMLQRYR